VTLTSVAGKHGFSVRAKERRSVRIMRPDGKLANVIAEDHEKCNAGMEIFDPEAWCKFGTPDMGVSASDLDQHMRLSHYTTRSEAECLSKAKPGYNDMSDWRQKQRPGWAEESCSQRGAIVDLSLACDYTHARRFCVDALIEGFKKVGLEDKVRMACSGQMSSPSQ
jgi:hypothetical protein